MQHLIDQILAECRFRENPYFRALAAGQFDRQDFLETQIQFYHAVTHFSRPMQSLAARLTDPLARERILTNVREEHGDGDVARSHGATFREFLARLGGISERELEARVTGPEVRLFNLALTAACEQGNPLLGVAMLGMIERMFSEISGWIGRGVTANGWITPDELVHYDLHVVLDVRHAQDFFASLDKSWDEDRGARAEIAQGLRLGANSFDAFYGALYRNRARRLLHEERAS